MSLQERLARLYGKQEPKRDVFGKRPATPEDLGRRIATPAEIARAIGLEEWNEADYPPTEADIAEKGD